MGERIDQSELHCKNDEKAMKETVTKGTVQNHQRGATAAKIKTEKTVDVLRIKRYNEPNEIAKVILCTREVIKSERLVG